MAKKRKPTRKPTRKHAPRWDAETQALVSRNPEPETETDDLVRYLGEDAPLHGAVILALVPPDMGRCQCEWPDLTQETFGPKPIVRCEQPPTVVAFQKRVAGDSTPTGAMTLCEDHRVLIEHMYPDQCYFRRITTERKIGSFA